MYKLSHIYTVFDSRKLWSNFKSERMLQSMCGRMNLYLCNFQSLQDYRMWGNQPSLYMTYDQHSSDAQMTQSNMSPVTDHHGFQWDKYRHQKHGESVDSGISAYIKKSKSFLAMVGFYWLWNHFHGMNNLIVPTDPLTYHRV